MKGDKKENNFKEIIYRYENSLGEIIEKRICSSLRDGKCIKKLHLEKGII